MFPVVQSIAKRVARICRLRETDDLVGDGALGLIRAIDAFDPGRGVTFDRYARHVILGSILNGLRKNDPVSERARRRVREGERLRAVLESRGETADEERLETALPGLRAAKGKVELGIPLSLDAPLPLGHQLRIDWGSDPASICEHRVRRAAARDALRVLSDRQRTIVVEHYFRDVSLRTISTRMAVTPQRVSQLHCAALERMRSTLGEAP